MTILEIADELLRYTKGDGRAAVVLALTGCASPAYLRAAPLSNADLKLDYLEPLDVDDQDAPHS